MSMALCSSFVEYRFLESHVYHALACDQYPLVGVGAVMVGAVLGTAPPPDPWVGRLAVATNHTPPMPSPFVSPALLSPE